MTTPEKIIKLEHVDFWYNKGEPAELEALIDINIEIDEGDYVAFFGPSGSGKTSLLYLISGVENSQQGKIIIKDRDISQFSNRELAIYRQVGVGIVFQQFNLIPNLTVLSNVALPMAFLGISEKKRQEEALKVLKRLGIDDLLDRYPNQLSGGQQQRVGIARALANNAPIIIADEPLGNLDSENSKKVLEFLKELHEKDKRTIIMVTHEAWSLRDVETVFYMKDGKVIKTEKTSGKDLAKSLSEDLVKELTPKETPTEKTASTIANVLLRGYSVEEIMRFQTFVDQRITGKIGELELFQILDKPFKDGGMGLWKQTAHRISNYLEDILIKKKMVEAFYNKLENDPLAPLKPDAVILRDWLLLEYHGKLSEELANRFDDIIIKRLRRECTAPDFKHFLILPQKEGGLGFAMHTAERILEKLELTFDSRDTMRTK